MFACVYMLICEDEFTIEVFIKTKENCKSFKEPHLLLQTTITMKVAATFIDLSTHGSSKKKREHFSPQKYSKSLIPTFTSPLKMKP